jgi:hypothetical protein
MTYTLFRTLPDGTEKSQGPFSTARRAAVAAGMVLYDNRHAGKAEAQRFSASLATRELGSEWTHTGSGYRFRIEKDG